METELKRIRLLAGKGGSSHHKSQSQQQRWACEGAPLPWEAELPGVLFALLDRETDPRLVSHVHDSLTSMLQAMLDDSLGHWLGLCKDVLTAAGEHSALLSLWSGLLSALAVASSDNASACV